MRGYGKINIDKEEKEEKSARVSRVTGEGPPLSPMPIPKKNISCPFSFVTYNGKKPSVHCITLFLERLSVRSRTRCRQKDVASKTSVFSNYMLDFFSCKSIIFQNAGAKFLSKLRIFQRKWFFLHIRFLVCLHRIIGTDYSIERFCYQMLPSLLIKYRKERIFVASSCANALVWARRRKRGTFLSKSDTGRQQFDDDGKTCDCSLNLAADCVENLVFILYYVYFPMFLILRCLASLHSRMNVSVARWRLVERKRERK